MNDGDTAGRRLLDDCFLHDSERMRHDEVLAALSERLTSIVEPEEVPLDQALGRYLAADVAAPRNVPLHDNSAVDGYAFAYSDYARRNTLGVVSRIAAGDLGPAAIESGQAARIFTGAVMPEGTDTVAMQEDCEAHPQGATVTVAKGLKPGANRRRAGEDFAAGQIALTAGVMLRPQEIALLAAFGMAAVAVHGRLRVAILSTGNELIEPGATELALGQVFDSNRAMVKSLLARLPVSVSDLGILPDDPQRIEATLIDAANGHDVLLTTGGASRGEEDHIIPALDRLGRRHLWQIAVKPGRPMTFGQIAARDHDCVFVGLPGNPVAAFVCFLLYVRPALALLGGGPAIAPPRFRVPAGFAIARRKTGRREFLRAWLEAGADGTLHAVKFPRDGSGLVSGLCAATGLIELPEDIEAIAPGDLVSFLPFEAF